MHLRQIVLFLIVWTGSVVAQEAGTYRVVLEPKFKTTISSEVTSTVTKLNKKMGEKFQKGEILMELDDTIFVFNQKKAEALKHNAETNLKTIQELYDEKSASQVQLSETQAALASTAADLALANKAVKSCHITAPYNGKVQEVFVQEYERVEAGQKLIDVIDDSILVAKLLIDSELVHELKIGKILTIHIPTLNKPFQATIAQISAGINPASSLIKVNATIDNTSEELRAGMIGIVQIGEKKIVPSQQPLTPPTTPSPSPSQQVEKKNVRI
jgi:membrane fusion protein, multidrug efflux system